MSLPVGNCLTTDLADLAESQIQPKSKHENGTCRPEAASAYDIDQLTGDVQALVTLTRVRYIRVQPRSLTIP